jgi:hypothetical protein
MAPSRRRGPGQPVNRRWVWRRDLRWRSLDVRASCWRASKGEARRLPPRPPPLDREDLVLGEPLPQRPQGAELLTGTTVGLSEHALHDDHLLEVDRIWRLPDRLHQPEGLVITRDWEVLVPPTTRSRARTCSCCEGWTPGAASRLRRWRPLAGPSGWRLTHLATRNQRFVLSGNIGTELRILLDPARSVGRAADTEPGRGRQGKSERDPAVSGVS